MATILKWMAKVIYENNLSADMVQKVIRVLSECKMPVVLEGLHRLLDR